MAKLVKVISEKVAVSEKPTVVRDERFSESYKVGAGAEIYIRQKPYWLTFAHFLILNSDDIRSKLISLARWIFGPTIGLGITIVAKIIANRNEIKTWEWTALVIGLLGSGILYLIGRKKPNPKKELLLDIEKHFKEHEEQLWVDREK